MARRSRKPKTLGDYLAQAIARASGDKAPSVPVQRRNTPRRFPVRTAEFRPHRQSPN